MNWKWPNRVDSETFAWTAALADDFDFLGVARAVAADQLEAALLGATRTTAVGAAVAAAHWIAHWFRRAAAVLHEIVAVLLFTARRSYQRANHRGIKVSVPTHVATLTNPNSIWYYLRRSICLPSRPGSGKCSSCRLFSTCRCPCGSGDLCTGRRMTLPKT